MAKKKPIPPSLQPRTGFRKPVPSKTARPTNLVEKSTPVPNPKMETPVEKKERFTLWLNHETYKAFKIHVAQKKGSGSDYIEQLIKKDLNL